MEYMYSALLLHSAGKKIDEEGIGKVLKAAGVKADETKIKAIVSSLEGVNIDEVISKPVAPVAQAAPEKPAEEKKEEKKKEKEEEKVSEEEAAEGLGALFG
ncbi:MAG: 50S ribosomal protein P1 [Candidatus Thermoplasmatota archaeon]|nr:50S ribosomal protein P1 [Candidatus Thermoplasmatota archaeon]MBU4256704.1 50S ribosomal protein P1 [Candidatus Thermoplasmatota archaeon]MCG2826124.1 50S ribosomal protein P1 [Thermoplasmatales archaeon]